MKVPGQEDIGIVSYGAGNIGAIEHRLYSLGFRAHRVTQAEEVSLYRRVILPGVGSFSSAVNRLRETSMFRALREAAETGNTAILGICLGMQLLFDTSEEGAGSGLGLIGGEVVSLSGIADLNGMTIPHIGWAPASLTASAPTPLQALNHKRFYFAHSFVGIPSDSSHIAATTNYGSASFPSLVRRENVIGAQFHPERSHRQGIFLLAWFCNADLTKSQGM